MNHSKDGALYSLERAGGDSKGGLTGSDHKEIKSSVNVLKNFMERERDALIAFAPLEDFAFVLESNRGQSIPINYPQFTQKSLDEEQRQALSPVINVDSKLQRISDSAHKDLVWVSIFAEEAKQRAQLLESKKPQDRGLLYGYTVGLKDMLNKQGYLSGWGAQSPVMSQAASDDAQIIKSLEKADAVIVGTLHMAEFALSPTGLNEWHGLGRSPVNPNHISGGSSSGSGMAVGAAHVTATIGSDTGGSIRLPAACCGVVGLKPTQGLVSVSGVMPLSPSLDCVGPLARTVSECKNVFLALTEQDDQADISEKIVLEHTDAADCILAVPSFSGDLPMSETMHQVVSDVKEKFRHLGVQIIEVLMPDLERLGLLSSVVLSVEATSYHSNRLQEKPNSYGRQVLRRLSRGYGLSGLDYFDALRLRGPLLEEFVKNNLQGAHALLLPTLPDVPPLVSQTVNREQAILEKEFSTLSWWTRGINFLGVPALSLPVGYSEEGLPLSIQLVGSPYGEMNILRLAWLLEQHLNLAIQDNDF